MPPEQWLVEPLSRHHNRTTFFCGNESLDNYLKELARQDERRRVAAPFVVINKPAPQDILGYYTLSSFGIDLKDLPEEIRKKLPTYPRVPATLLGRLAVNQRYHGQGLGEFLLMDALKRAYVHSSEIGSAAVVVDAIDHAAVLFYQHFNFLIFPDIRNRLFLPMGTIAKLAL